MLRTRLGFQEVDSRCMPCREALGNLDEQETVATTDVQHPLITAPCNQEAQRDACLEHRWHT
jgi:hypothetical protein